MRVQPFHLKGLLLIQPRVFQDQRGTFFESYHHDRYASVGSFVQDNAVFSIKNVLRGLHYQEKPGQAKLISALHGRIWDVAVDIRPDSSTYGQWIGVELSDQNHLQFFVPIGFAHGYCVLSDSACVHYKVSAMYDPAQERTIRWDDPRLGIQWPIQSPILSERDLQGSSL